MASVNMQASTSEPWSMKDRGDDTPRKLAVESPTTPTRDDEVSQVRKMTGPTTVYAKPYIPTFSGNAERKGDVTFRQWKYSIGCLKRDDTMSLSALTAAAKRSLKGDAAELVMNIGEEATLDDVITALKIPYGEVEWFNAP